LEEFIVDMGGNFPGNKDIPLRTTFHYSTIPSFHIQGKDARPKK
jgi:hypothetical protein